MNKREYELIVAPYMLRADLNKTKIAKVINMTPQAYSARTRNPDMFRRWELGAIANYLNMSNEDRGKLID